MSVQLQMSPLQLKELLYKKILIEAAVDLTEAEGYWAPTFDFEGVKLVADLAVGFAKGQQDDPRQFMVEMTVAIPNDPEDGKRAPYTLDIQAQAWIEVADGIPKDKRREIVEVNGASLILGAIRELVLQVTGRSGLGPMLLPTLRFLPQPAPGSDPSANLGQTHA